MKAIIEAKRPTYDDNSMIPFNWPQVLRNYVIGVDITRYANYFEVKIAYNYYSVAIFRQE